MKTKEEGEKIKNKTNNRKYKSKRKERNK